MTNEAAKDTSKALNATPAAALMLIWAVGWTAAGIAQLVDGPKLVFLSDGQIPFGGLQYAEAILGLAVAVAVGWAGFLLLREHTRSVPVALGAMSALLLHRVTFALTDLAHVGDTRAWVQQLVGSGMLSDVVCVAALVWFVVCTGRSGTREYREVPRVVDLALLILLGREALVLLVHPIPVASLSAVLRMLEASPVYTVVNAVGMVLGMAVAGLGLARIAGARTIARATSLMLGASLILEFILLGTQYSGPMQQIPGVTTRLSIYAVGIVALIERGLLISAIDERDEE